MGSGDQDSGRWQTRVSRREFAYRVMVALGLLIVSAGLLLLLWLTARVWLVVFAGYLLAIFLSGLAELLRRHSRLSHGWALTLVIIGLLGLGSLGGWLMAGPFAEQISELQERLPAAVERVTQDLQKQPWGQFLISKIPAASATAESSVSKLLSSIAHFFSGTVTVFSSIMLIIFLGLYLAVSPGSYTNGLMYLLPPEHREKGRIIFGEMNTTVRYWLLGQAISMLTVGVLIGTGLKLLGVPLPLALGILTGLFDFIPIVGPILSAVPAILLGFVQSPTMALYVFLLYVLVFFVESHLLMPLIHVYTVSLPPALTILNLFLMTELFGFLGVLLATPLLAVLLVLIKNFYIEGVLGDTSVPSLAGMARRGLIRRRKAKESASS